MTLDLPARGSRRRVVATLPLLQIVDDRDGPAFGDLPSDTDDSVKLFAGGVSDDE